MVFQETVVQSGPMLWDAKPTPHVRLQSPQQLTIAVLAAVGGALATGAATGTVWWDVVLRVGFAVLLTMAMQRVSNLVALSVTVVATVFAVPSIVLPVAVLALVGAAAGLWLSRAAAHLQSTKLGWVIRATTSLLAVQVLLRLPELGFFGLQSTIVAVIALVVGGLGFETLAKDKRRRINSVASVVVVIVVFVLVVSGIAILGVRSRANDGIDAARRGLGAARAADTVALTSELNVAATALDDAHGRLASPLLKPLRLVPIVAQHHRALEVASAEGAAVAREAVAVANEADIGSLRFRQGSLDLDRLESMAPRLAQTAERLEEANGRILSTRNPWLITALDDQLVTLTAELGGATHDARVAADAADVLPQMLGVDGSRRYLMLVGSPGETRDFGGFVGAYGLIELAEGDLSLIDGGRALDLAPLVASTGLDDPAGYPTQFRNNEPEIYPQNLTSTPNFEIVARAVKDLFPELAGRPIDGVIYIDQFAIAALLELTGAVQVPEAGVELDADNAIDFFFRGQYENFESRTEVWGAIASVLSAAIRGLEGSDLPGPERLGEVLGPSARQGRLQVVTFDERENAFLQSVRLQRVFSAPSSGDSLAVVASQGTTSKLDLYLHRELAYRVVVDEAGGLAASLDIVLRSEIPADAPTYTLAFDDPEPGTNRVLLSVYSQHELQSVEVNGVPHRFVAEREFGLYRYSLFGVEVPANQEVRARLVFEGIAPEEPYTLAVWHQPTVRPDVLQLEVNRPDSPAQSMSLSIEEDVVIGVP